MFALFALIAVASAEYVITKSGNYEADVIELDKCFKVKVDDAEGSTKYLKISATKYKQCYYSDKDCVTEKSCEEKELGNGKYETTIPSYVLKIVGDSVANCPNVDSNPNYKLFLDVCFETNGVSAKAAIEDNKVVIKGFSDKECKTEIPSASAPTPYTCDTCSQSGNAYIKYVCVKPQDPVCDVNFGKEYKYVSIAEMFYFNLYNLNDDKATHKYSRCNKDYVKKEENGKPTYIKVDGTNVKYEKDVPANIAYATEYKDSTTCENGKEVKGMVKLFKNECVKTEGGLSAKAILDGSKMNVRMFKDDKCGTFDTQQTVKCDVCSDSTKLTCKEYGKGTSGSMGMTILALLMIFVFLF